MITVICPAITAGQDFEKEFNPFPVIIGQDTLAVPFFGGFNSPKPQLLDFDRDGLVDLMVGELNGTISWFKNGGTAEEPRWDPLSKRLGNVDANSWSVFADLDGDDDVDLLADRGDNFVVFYRNESIGEMIDFVVADSVLDSIRVGLNNTPDLTDIDNDGDLDFFYGNLSGGLTLYRNTGTSLVPDFEFETDVYDSVSAIITSLSLSSGMHGFSAISFVDVDYDGDRDLFYGDIFNSNLYYFANLGSPEASDLTFVTQDYLPLTTLGHNHADGTDLDGDGDMDLVVGAANGNDRNNLILVRNDGTLEAPVWTVVDSTVIDMIDFGSNTMPAFGDLDGDGDFDLLVGTELGTICYFENVGNIVSPSFRLRSENFAGVDVGLSAAPELVDWDGDGDLDLLLGTWTGKIEFWRNEGDQTSFVPVQVMSELAGITVDAWAVPQAVDFDGNGRWDLLVGEWDFQGMANVLLYRGNGDTGDPVLTLLTETLLPEAERLLTIPALYDWNEDGVPDLIVGGQDFGVEVFVNGAGPGEFPDASHLSPVTGSVVGSADVQRAAVASVDIDADGDLDLFMGEQNGGLEFSLRRGSRLTIGDINFDGAIDAEDVIYLVNFLALDGPGPLPNGSSADVDCSGAVELADIIYLLRYLYQSGSSPCIP
jgi:hypothetical protein